MEYVGAGVALAVGTLVGEFDGDARVEVGQLAQTVGEDVVLVGGGGEYLCVGPELLAGAAQFGFANHLDGIERLALGIFLLVNLAIAEYLRDHASGEGVDAGHTYAVQTARYLVRTLVELTAGMKYGHDDFESRAAFFGVHVNGDASAVVLHDNGVVLTDGYFDVGTIASKGFVNGVVHGLVYQVVQTFFADIADIHGGALTHGLQAF